MPVPVSPGKQESSRDDDGAAAGEEVHHAFPPGANPTRYPQHGEDAADPDVVAGYEDCLEETLRFLVEEEQLPGDHPVVQGLITHLTRQHAHTELAKLSQQVATVPTSVTSLNAGFQVTLVQDEDDEDGSDEDMEDDDQLVDMDDLEEEDDLDREASEAFRRQLLRFVYQGCDLFAAPQAGHPRWTPCDQGQARTYTAMQNTGIASLQEGKCDSTI
ncbi:uncharacterized protein LOC123513127 [Portunus trituberculatus]|uniref:Orange domain-containing protein n=1 Tax=Portunus trituberculatus TaxID=210409 RepID=A0A5B7FXG7_PORTR|nr:uncharacterized protein LOC123513127 [Portunus trituberculatus]MPC49004.1 hypothetical protein [Portunus trituberculatus]